MSKNDIYKLAKAIGWTAFGVAGVASGSVITSVTCIILAKNWWEDILGNHPI